MIVHANIRGCGKSPKFVPTSVIGRSAWIAIARKRAACFVAPKIDKIVKNRQYYLDLNTQWYSLLKTKVGHHDDDENSLDHKRNDNFSICPTSAASTIVL